MADDNTRYSPSMVLNAEQRRRLEHFYASVLDHGSESATIKAVAFGAAGTAAAVALGVGIWRRLTGRRGAYDSVADIADSVTVISSSGAKFVFGKELAEQSTVMHAMVEGRCPTLLIWSAFTTDTLQKVMDYLKEHAVVSAGGGAAVDPEPFDQGFVRMNFRSLFQVYLAAEFFEIKPLRKIAKAALKLMLVMKTDEEIGALLKSK